VEAALMKVPVAAFEVEGIREVIEHNASGIVVPQYNMDALYEGAKRVLSDERVANCFREKAFTHVEHEWDATKMGDDLRKVYQQAEKKIHK
jgi:glycosyltransferase involved in cell wall biosynthesis